VSRSTLRAHGDAIELKPGVAQGLARLAGLLKPALEIMWVDDARLRSEQQTVSRPVRGESEVALPRDVTAVPATSTTNLITRPATRMVP
jgi:hypothetical protein